MHDERFRGGRRIPLASFHRSPEDMTNVSTTLSFVRYLLNFNSVLLECWNWDTLLRLSQKRDRKFFFSQKKINLIEFYYWIAEPVLKKVKPKIKGRGLKKKKKRTGKKCKALNVKVRTHSSFAWGLGLQGSKGQTTALMVVNKIFKINLIRKSIVMMIKRV